MIREKTIVKYYNSGYFLDLERKDSGQAKETAKKDCENVPRIIQEERASVSVVERGGKAKTKKKQTAAKIDRRRGGKAGEAK